MNNLVISPARRPRMLTLIYCLQVYDDVVMLSGLFKNRTSVNAGVIHPNHLYVHTPLPPRI